MALVAYANSSSSSESEDDEVPQVIDKKNNTSHVPNSKITSGFTKESLSDNSQSVSSGTLFTNLPQPKTHIAVIIDKKQDEFLQKREKVVEKPKNRIKIEVPALSDLHSDDDDEPLVKKSKQQVKASGLFALLPKPKGTPLSNTSVVPNVLQMKANNVSPRKLQKPEIQPKVNTNGGAKPSTNGVATTISKGVSDSENGNDFEIPETFDDETWQKVCGKKKLQSAPAPFHEAAPTVNIADTSYRVEAAPAVSQPYKGLDNQAFKKLVGSRKRVKENIHLIDIHEDEIRPDKEQWLKSLTDLNCEPTASVDNPVNNACKVKNYITALAQKALANDKELQMRWSEIRYNRRQTQAKYGF